MALAAVASVASFSAVLAESFAAVGLSTIMPNLFIAAAKAARGAALGGAADPRNLEALVSVVRTLPDAGSGTTTPIDSQTVTKLKGLVSGALTTTSSQPPVADSMGGMFGEGNVIKKALEIVKNGAAAIDHLDVLVPQKAVIDAEFEFHAGEKYSVEAGLGAAIEMVTIKAGYSAMYESSSRNKVSLRVEFGLVGVDL